MKNLEKLKKRILEYEQLKLRFLKEQNIDVSTQESEGMVAVHQQEDEQVLDDENSDANPKFEKSDASRSDGFKVDEENDEKLRFKQRHTKHRNFHAGYDDEEFYVDENLFLLYPPMNRARPSNCIQFRVIKLSNETTLDDKVVGWGVFPLLNSELEFNEGRFKIPILFGDVDEEVTLYRNIQSQVMRSLDSWLCNMYFEIEPLLIQRLKFDWKAKEMYYEKSQLNKQHGFIYSKRQEDLNASMLQQDLRNSLLDNRSVRSSKMERKMSIRDPKNLLTNLRNSNLEQSPKKSLNRQQTQLLDSVINEEHKQLQKEVEREIRDELDDDALMLESYSFSVSDKFNYETRNVAKKKLVYLFTESLADMGLKNMNSIAFQITLFVIILSFWARVYIHYFGEYLALLMIGIGVSKFNPEWYKVELHYEAWESWHEVIIIILGVLLNTLFFLILTIVSYFVNKYTQFPHIFYKMICWFGIATAVDFILIFLVDCIEQNWGRADMFKLYYYYNRRDSNGWPGLIMTFFIYGVLLFINLSLLYYYLIFVHMGGRVIDIYHRLSGNVNHFFLPHDDEISLTYLKWVCAKALRFNHRVTNAEDKVIDEHGKEVPVHFIYVHKFDKETHELYSYRSFIRDYDGAIREMHIQKKILSNEMKEGITGNLPPKAGRHTFNREEFFNISKESEEDLKQEAEGEKDSDEEEKTPFQRSVMDSNMNLKDQIDSSRNRFVNGSRDSSEDRKIADYDRSYDESDDEKHLKKL